MASFSRIVLTSGLFAAASLAGASAMAQEGRAAVTTEGATTNYEAARATGDSDHDQFVGSFAVGYLGASLVPIASWDGSSTASPVGGITAQSASVYAPVVGIRYWFTDMIGLDVGLGFRTFSGSVEREVAEQGADGPVKWDWEEDKVSQTAVLIHAGVPIALKAERHYVFELIPEANFGFSSGTYKFANNIPPSAADQPQQPQFADVDLSGLRLDVGARVGAEIHFGFIDLPNLALQAGVGLYLSMENFKAEGASRAAPEGQPASAAIPATSYKDSSMTISTSVNNDPWAIFTNNISALYYF